MPVSFEPVLYHNPDRFGYFSVLQSSADSKRQRTYRLNRLDDVIAGLDLNCDTWISQAEFSQQNRRVVNFLRVGLAWADIDYYNTQYAGSCPEKLAEQILWFCSVEGHPIPSVVIASGRGLQVKWLFTSPIPDRALVRWNALQKRICDIFMIFGADVKSRDASRVLRLVGSRNTKSGEQCRIIYDNSSCRYGFDELCDYILPYSRDDLRQQRSKARQESKLKVIAPDKKKSQCAKFSVRTLSWHRLLDLRKLCKLRGWESTGAEKGYQDWFLFLAVCFLSWSIAPDRLFQEVKVLAKEFCPTWQESEAQAVVKTAIARAIDAQNGKRVEYRGRLLDPRYTFRNDTLIETLKITDDEQQQLLTIISVSEKNRRKTEARRKAGVIDRQKYLLTAEQRRVEARIRRSRGESYRQI